MSLTDAIGAGLLQWPLRRLGFGLAVVAALFLLRPVITDAIRCSSADWAACRSVR